MPKFFYFARDKTGRKITGSEDASSQEELIGRLQARNLIVVNVLFEEKDVFPSPKPSTNKFVSRRLHYRITSNDLVLFCRQLATLLGAGVTILNGLEIISKQISSRKFYTVIKHLQRSMERGLSLHEALARHPQVFSELWVNLVDSGEASGNLAMVLSRFASYLERYAAFKNKLISGVTYPLVLFFAGIGALLFLTTRIIPTFAELFEGFNLELPFLTQLLITISFLIRRYILIIISIILVVFWMFRAYIKTKEGRKTYENFKFRLPVFGEFFRALIVERFSSEMSTLLESGVPLLYSLEIAEHGVGNLIIADVIRQIKENVREGKSLTQPLEQSGFFEPLVVQMVSIGEEIGNLPEMFKRIDTFYQEYVETFLIRFTTLFEPIMLIFMGVIIGTLVIGMFLPIFQIARIAGG